MHLVLRDALLHELAQRLAHDAAARAERRRQMRVAQLLALADAPVDDRRAQRREHLVRRRDAVERVDRAVLLRPLRHFMIDSGHTASAPYFGSL